MGEMSGRSKIVIGVIVAVVIMCAIIIPIAVIVNNQREQLEVRFLIEVQYDASVIGRAPDPHCVDICRRLDGF